jgi:hypothetical protein
MLLYHHTNHINVTHIPAGLFGHTVTLGGSVRKRETIPCITTATYVPRLAKRTNHQYDSTHATLQKDASEMISAENFRL